MIKQIKINETSKAIKSLWGNKRVIQNNIRTNCLKLIEAALLLSEQRLLCSHLGAIKIFAQPGMGLKIPNSEEDERKNEECSAGFPVPGWTPGGRELGEDGEDEDGSGWDWGGFTPFFIHFFDLLGPSKTAQPGIPQNCSSSSSSAGV